jgi:tRNA(Ile)-lysidine synthetase-like protein
MEVNLEPGKYIAAVSGGVDSTVLLHLISQQKDVEVVVAHFNHGIRAGSAGDEKFVAGLSQKMGLPFEVGYGRLGADASEDQARKARYEFLEQVKQKHEAAAIVTAHHQDDLIETAAINILRGTGPRGLIAICANREIIRPLLGTPKKEILDYAAKNKLKWVEDKSNEDRRYLRNSVRQVLQTKLTAAQRAEILGYINDVMANQEEASELIGNLENHLFEDELTLKRSSFIFLPGEVANEMVLHWLRRNGVSADRPLVNRLSVLIKTGRPNSQHDVGKHYKLKLSRENAYLTRIS